MCGVLYFYKWDEFAENLYLSTRSSKVQTHYSLLGCLTSSIIHKQPSGLIEMIEQLWENQVGFRPEELPRCVAPSCYDPLMINVCFSCLIFVWGMQNKWHSLACVSRKHITRFCYSCRGMPRNGQYVSGHRTFLGIIIHSLSRNHKLIVPQPFSSYVAGTKHQSPILSVESRRPNDARSPWQKVKAAQP